jgi:quercetin dioxygenase-like cupin family protein
VHTSVIENKTLEGFIMKIENIKNKIAYSDKTISKRVLFAEDKVLNFMLNLRPGQTIPPHTHEQSDLVLHVLFGDGEATVDGNVQKITDGDVIHMRGEEVFGMTNTGDRDMSCFVVITPNPSSIYAHEI